MSRRGSFGSRFDQGPSNGPRPPRYDDQGPSGYRAERYEDQGSSGSFRGASRGGGPGRQHNASKPYSSNGRPGRNDVRARSTSPAPRPNASLGSSAFSRRGASGGQRQRLGLRACRRVCVRLSRRRFAVLRADVSHQIARQTAHSRARIRCSRPTSSPIGRRARSRSARSSSATSK